MREPDFSWGLLGPGSIAGERRTRTLGLAATIRRFNELAVPGVGGIRFGKEALLSALAIQVAREAGRGITNTEAATAIEALACWLAFDHNNWQRDARLRGRMRLPQDSKALTFSAMRSRSFYVTQTMRMATVGAMVPLGLATSTGGQRFNAFALTPEGERFVEVSLARFSPSNRSVADHLRLWVSGEGVSLRTPTLLGALSPSTPLPVDARSLLRARLQRGATDPLWDPVLDKTRRIRALEWVRTLRHQPHRDWTRCPEQIEPAHWFDLRAGALLFAARDAAIEMLNSVEAQMSLAASERWPIPAVLPSTMRASMEALQVAAREFVALAHGDAEANAFCAECLLDPSIVIAKLLMRDGRVLRLVDGEARRGSARRGVDRISSEGDDEDSPEEADVDIVHWPEQISYRIANLDSLDRDLDEASASGEIGVSP